MKTKYRLKPYLIDACKFDGSIESAEAIIGWANGSLWADIPSDPTKQMTLKLNKSGDLQTCSPGDYVVRGVLPGEFFIEKPTVFNSKYEEVK